MSGPYLAAFVSALVVSAVLTPLMRSLALRYGWLDKPNHRKVHTTPVPRMGGVAIYLAFVLPLLYFTGLNRPLYGMLAGITLLFLVGLYDDLRGMNTWFKLGWQVIAAVAILAGGLGIIFFTNPFGGVIALDSWRIPIELGPVAFNIIPVANLVSIIWIVGIINTVNFLDGLDGLAAGVSIIAGLVLFVTALTVAPTNPLVALLAIILVGALLGFLPYNFFPSSIFMGDSGAYVVGALLALLSIYGGAKISVGALVLGIAIVDALWTVLRRLLKRRSPFTPDRSHLHHRLLDTGVLSHRQVVVLLYLLTIVLALALLFGSALSAVLLVMLLLVVALSVIRIVAAKQRRTGNR